MVAFWRPQKSEYNKYWFFLPLFQGIFCHTAVDTSILKGITLVMSLKTGLSVIIVIH